MAGRPLQFIATLRRSGDSLVVTVPYEIAKFGRLKRGDVLDIVVRKAKTDE